MALDQPVIQWSSELASTVAANKAINDVEEYQKCYVCYASRGYLCEAANLPSIRAHSSNDTPITARLDIVAAPAEYCLPIKKDRRFAPEFTIQVTLGTATPDDVTAKVLACPFSETHRRGLSTPVQQRLPQFLVNEALGKGQPASEEDRQKWYLSFKGQTSVCLNFDRQRDVVPHTVGSQTVMQKRGTFSGLEYLKSSHMERVYLLFVMTLGDSPDIIATLFTVPTIVICRASQRRLATERLGYPLSVYDDLRTRGCSYNLPSRKSGSGAVTAAAPCRTAAAAVAAVAAAAVGGTDTLAHSSGGVGGVSNDPSSAAAVAAVAAGGAGDVAGAAAKILAGSDCAALMSHSSQAFPAFQDGGKQAPTSLGMMQPGLAKMNGLEAIFDLVPRDPKAPVSHTHSDGGCVHDRAAHVDAQVDAAAGAAHLATKGTSSQDSKGGSGGMEDDDEMTQDDDDPCLAPNQCTPVNNVCGNAEQRGTKRSLPATPPGPSATTATPASEVLQAGATNLAWLRVGQQQHASARQAQPALSEAHNLVSKLPRLSGRSDNPAEAGVRPLAATRPTPAPSIKTEDRGVNNVYLPVSTQPLQELLALCSGQATKPQLAPPAAPASGCTEQKGAAVGGAAAVASSLRATAAAAGFSAPVARKASALDIQKLYQIQSKHGGLTDASAGPSAAVSGAVMLGTARFEMPVHEEVLKKNAMSADVLTSIPSGTVRLPNRFSETAVRRAVEFLYSGRTSLDAENALMTLEVGAYLEAPTLITYCFDFVIEWIQGTIGKLCHPLFPSAAAPAASTVAAALPAGDRGNWPVNNKLASDASAAGAVLSAALSMDPATATALRGVARVQQQQQQQARRTSAAQAHAPLQQQHERLPNGLELVLEQSEAGRTTTPTPPSSTAAAAPRTPQGEEAAAHMDLLLRLAQAQATNGSEGAGTGGAPVAGLRAALGSSVQAKEGLPVGSAGTVAANTAPAPMSVSGVSTDTGNASGLPASSPAAAGAVVKRGSDEGTTVRAPLASNDGGSLPFAPTSAAKESLSAAVDASPPPTKAGRGVSRSPNCGASVAERRMHEQRAAEEERMRQLQLANDSRELLAALLDTAQTTPEILSNPQTAELVKHLLMSEQAARAAAGAAGQISIASGYHSPAVAAAPR